MDRPSRVQACRRRALGAGVAGLVALGASGCGAGTPSGGASQAIGTPEIVTGAQVITSCYQNYFYNGILPRAAAKANCSSCVEQRLRVLGIRPTAGENEADVLTGVRLSSRDINSLQTACNETDASAQ